jgi:hypothetical protein
MTYNDTLVADRLVEKDAAKFADHDDFEASFRRDFPKLWLMTLIVPVVVTVIALLAIMYMAGVQYVNKLIGTAVLTFFFFGRFVILAGQAGDLNDIGKFMTAEQLFVLVTYMDVMTTLLVAFHLGFLFRIPILGPRAASLVSDGHFVLGHYPWMRNAAFVGLTTFVAFPLAATGGVGGSILGRLLGLSRRSTFVATIIGCLIGNGAMYLLSDLINGLVDKDHPIIKYGGVICIVVVITCLELRYRKLKESYCRTV